MVRVSGGGKGGPGRRYPVILSGAKDRTADGSEAGWSGLTPTTDPILRSAQMTTAVARYRFARPISGAPDGGSYARIRSSSAPGSDSTMIVSRCAGVRNSSLTAWSRNVVSASK